jgi:hypothetical protein
MPFGGWFDDYYTAIFRPAIEAAGLVPCRADDLYRPSTIVNNIWTYTKEAKIILADLTDKNPNVFYELGLAHALAKPAIIVAESIDDVPFDLRALRVIEYNKNAPDWGALLRQKIEISIEEILKSPLESVLPVFLNVKGSTTPPTVTPHEKEILELKQDMELLRREIRNTNDLATRRSRDRISPAEARHLLRSYLERGLPREAIVDRLSESGVGRAWTQNQLNELLGPERVAENENISTTPESES